MESSSKLYSSSSSAAMDEAVNINTNNNNNKDEGMINTMSSSSSSRRHRSKEMENLSFELSKYPRDLLQTFMGNNSNNNNYNSNQLSTRSSSSSRSDEPRLEEGEEDEGLNLGLGLSLGGIFGVDKSKNKGLIRSSSIAGTMPLYKEDDMGVAPPPTPGSNHLVRTSSLPVETEEEWRKRKEMQTLRRMEAKRRRSEKQRVLKETGFGGVVFGVGGGGGGSGSGSGGEERGGGGGVEGLKLRARLEREQQCLGITSKLIGSSMGSLFGSPKPPQPSSSNTNTNNPPTPSEIKGRRTTFGSLQGFLTAQAQTQVQAQAQTQAQTQTQSQPQSPTQSQYLYQYQSQSLPHIQPQQGSSQGSEGSQGATSSDASEFESKPRQGSSSCGEARSPASIHSQQDRGSGESFGHSVTKDDPIQRACRPEAESLSKQPESANNNNKRKGASGSSGIEDMPCVFTIGDGPNGRKVEGILYKYGKGEEVRIMCVCHGNFFSPSEFVKHAGGKDVEHPLRHIVVSPSTSAFQ